MARPQLILTCEHGGNSVPQFVAEAFTSRGAQSALASHRGQDSGALWLAKRLHRDLGVPLVHATVSRLVVDLNRTIGHPRHFSEFTKSLDEALREKLLARYYMPYRRKVTTLIAETIEQAPVVHLSVHSFVPVLDGKKRNAEVGLLYDPSRAAETQFCTAWLDDLSHRAPQMRVRRNYPYRGSSDGFTSYLRTVFADGLYAGIELEVNQAILASQSGRRAVHAALRGSLEQLLVV